MNGKLPVKLNLNLFVKAIGKTWALLKKDVMYVNRF
jgi:hypothetical protein